MKRIPPFHLVGKRFYDPNAPPYKAVKNGELFLEKLFAIEEKPTDMNDEITWYLNIATAFSVLGKKNKSISLLKQLEEVTTGEDKELIQKSIEFIQGQIENG